MVDAYDDVQANVNVYLIRDSSYADLALSDPDHVLKAGSSYPKDLVPSPGKYVNHCVLIRTEGGADRDYDEVSYTCAHEIGHLMVGSGHPDKYLPPGNTGGIAPLQSLPLTKRMTRLMAADGTTESKLLVKSEWDAAEQWLIENVDSQDDE